MRGNLAPQPDVQGGGRSIPAYAGEPYPLSVLNTPVQVYPRVCGGTSAAAAAASCAGGLSPRMRGNRKMQCHLPPRHRSIPAYAGEPDGDAPCHRFVRVYPRVCGGTPGALPVAAFANGLSPRMRGNPTVTTAKNLAIRSIPAYAGEPDR